MGRGCEGGSSGHVTVPPPGVGRRRPAQLQEQDWLSPSPALCSASAPPDPGEGSGLSLHQPRGPAAPCPLCRHLLPTSGA